MINKAVKRKNSTPVTSKNPKKFKGDNPGPNKSNKKSPDKNKPITISEWGPLLKEYQREALQRYSKGEIVQRRKHYDNEEDSDIEDSTSDDSSDSEESDEGQEEVTLKNDGADEDDEDEEFDIEKLKEVDPDFFTYLEEIDKGLLNFEYQDDEAEDPEEEADEDEKVPVLEKIDASVLKEWKTILKENPTRATLKQVILSLRRVIEQLGDAELDFIGIKDFNQFIIICMSYMVPALYKVLNLKEGSKLKKNPKWKPFKTLVLWYLQSIQKLLMKVSYPKLIVVLLSHLNKLTIFCPEYPKLSRNILQLLVTHWCTTEEKVRLNAFVVIMKLLGNLPDDYTKLTLKNMYIYYLKSSKFMSSKTWPMINFMKHSIVEAYSLCPKTAYEHSCVYVRLLGIHLRRALTVNQTKTAKLIHSWQNVQALLLWSMVVSHHSSCKEVVNPLVQVILGNISLTTTKFLPMRFFLIRALIHISSKTGVFIPILRYILEVLNTIKIKKPSKEASNNPLSLTSNIKLKKEEIAAKTFLPCIISEVVQLSLMYLANISHDYAFPEIIVLPKIRLRAFMEKSIHPTLQKSIKQLIIKMDENAKFIEKKRKGLNFTTGNSAVIGDWENGIKEKGTPLSKYYDSQKQNKKVVAPKTSKETDEIVATTNVPDLPEDFNGYKVVEFQLSSDEEVELTDDESDEEPDKEEEESDDEDDDNEE